MILTTLVKTALINNTDWCF